MRIATWNVNSLKARLEKVLWWLNRAKPDVLLMQETKLTDEDAPVNAFEQAGYELAHHGEGRWNGVAIASRCGIGGVITNFGEPLRLARALVTTNHSPSARMITAECAGIRVVFLTRRTAGRWTRHSIGQSLCGSTGWLAGSIRPSLRILQP
ncbi:MAG: endonuclease/exonuclease/phosphatase family protein [Nitrospiraceae bacterium]